MQVEKSGHIAIRLELKVSSQVRVMTLKKRHKKIPPIYGSTKTHKVLRK